jgi:hypothetical protein
MVAFHFSLAPPISPSTPAGSIVFEAFVEPHFGFYSFLVATMLSLLITHLVIKIHDFSLQTGISLLFYYYIASNFPLFPSFLSYLQWEKTPPMTIKKPSGLTQQPVLRIAPRTR